MTTVDDTAGAARSLLFRALGPSDDQAPLTALLTGAGAPSDELGTWCDGGQVYALCDLAGCAEEPPAGTVVTRPGPEEGTVEVCYVAVDPGRRGCGLGGRLLSEVAHALLATGARRLVASAQPADTERLALLERAGFRPAEPAAAGGGRRWFTREL